MTIVKRVTLPVTLALFLAACGNGQEADNAVAGNTAEEAGHGEAEGEHKGEAAKEAIVLTPRQITAAGVQIVRPSVTGGGGVLTLPATIEGDPQGTQVVSAAIGGRVVSLTRNLGQSIGRGQTLAIIESREAASLKAEVEAARARSALAQSQLRREQRLFAERVSPEQDLIAARTAATEAGIALRLAQQQVAAAGGGGGALNRIGIASPIGGQVIARSVTLGQTVAANAELFRVANLSQVAVTVSLSPTDAGLVRPGSSVTISAGGRRSTARVSFVSPILDETTRQVQVIAIVDNRAGQWRVGEPVTAAIQLPGAGSGTVTVPAAAVQSIENRSMVFVRTPTGFAATPVVIGQASGSNVVVTSGLTGREEIAATGSFTLKAELGKGEAEHED
ncbi:efflux RND transporter periplasmic adaptor subunit [Sphingomonas hankookensis]|uniref:efflux RND transporter periplasmic adaptor subunit n=1 Tax=Sphingomonas hankookensis TaxID=563996 RepID=UPI001F56628D|nr:efflux RND transporter periplasmic adaptor subunit [Sphingomonas hankookensis]